MKPNSIPSYLQLSRLKLSLGELSSALQSLKDCLRLDPDQKECKKEYRVLKKLDKELGVLEKDVGLGKWLTARDWIIGQNGLLKRLDGALKGDEGGPLKGRVYSHACKIYSEVNILSKVVALEKSFENSFEGDFMWEYIASKKR